MPNEKALTFAGALQAFDCRRAESGLGCVTMTRLFFILLAALFLSGCGIKGSLATPAPILSKSTPVESVEVETEESVEDEDDGPFYGPDFKDPLTGERN